MYKFKFDPPQQHRRSIQQPKSEHVATFTVLDKCTQILREDRLWLRNQIKNNNSEVLDLFKQYPRTSQLQNLQIKLRKYVQAVKSKLKQQQLHKFKETLYQQHSLQPEPEPRRAHERTHTNTRTNQSSSKAAVKGNTSLQLNRTAQCRMGRSQDQRDPAPVQMSSSLRHFQDLLKYKYNQDIIEERDSQNVTSARLARQENQHQRPLQEQNYSSVQNRPSIRTGKETISKQPINKYDFNKRAPNRFAPPEQDSSKWGFEAKAKQVLYKYKGNEEEKEKEIQEINVGFASRLDHEEFAGQDREESIFDKHFNQSEKNSAKNDQYDSSSNHTINQFGSNPTSKMQRNIGIQEKLIMANSRNEPKYHQPFEIVQSNFSSTVSDTSGKKKATVQHLVQSDRKSDQNLFTPLDLLNQCRNFLKNRQNSIKKSGFYNHLPESIKGEEVKQPIMETKQANMFDSKTCKMTQSKQEESLQCLFSRNKIQEPCYPKQPSAESKKEEDSSYLFPQARESNEKPIFSQESTKKEDKGYNYPHFQTFANSSDIKKPIQKALSPPQFGRPSKQPLKQTPLPQVPSSFSIEDCLQTLMQLTEMNPFITPHQLSQFTSTHKHHLFLTHTLSPLTHPSSKSEICLASIAEKLSQAYSKQNGSDYPHTDKAVNAVYDLLDIEFKGYISREDIDNFLQQIEEAEVQNFDEVCEELLRLFDGADFTNEQRLSYWHLYLVKNSEEFQRVSQLLGEFEFQIERSD